jgi:hypothetical protein
VVDRPAGVRAAALALVVAGTLGNRAPARADAWLESVQRDLAAREYEVAASSDGFTASSRTQGLRATWRGGVLEVSPRTAARDWRWRHELTSVGRLRQPVEAVSRAEAAATRLELHRGADLVEWYVNSPSGLEQGFTIARRPDGDPARPLVIESRIDGLLAFPAGDGQSVLLRTPDGRDALRLRELVVTDAAGARLPSCLDVGWASLSILVDDRDAAYPVTVDPLLTSPSWSAESDVPGAELGYSVAGAGDVNGDGYSDLVAGAPAWASGEPGEGAAFLYLGSPTGLTLAPAWMAEGDQADAAFGNAVATAGDVNGDGHADVIVGAYGFDNDSLDEGRALVYLGTPFGLSPAPAWAVEGDRNEGRMGVSVATAGDVDGDGFDDVLVGSDSYTNGEMYEGRAWLYLGGPVGPSTTPAWVTEPDQEFAGHGWAVAPAGDVNADGFDDVLVGAFAHDGGEIDEGRALLYLGSSVGLSTTPAWTFEPDQPEAQLGIALSTAGDVNGDGHADVVVGAHQAGDGGSREGVALVFLGSPQGLEPAPAWTAEADQGNAGLGWSVATAGDVNGDLFADVVVSASRWDGAFPDEGLARVYLGSASGLAPAPAWSAEGGQATAAFGQSVALAGDVNGDGYSDVAVGASLIDAGEDGEGRITVYHGGPTGLQATPGRTLLGTPTPSRFAARVAAAGDVDGDGYSDLLVGTPLWDGAFVDAGRVDLHLGGPDGPGLASAWSVEGDRDGAELGTAFAGAGDVDGDGYSDVLVGAPRWADTLGDQGAAYLYAGSALGLAATPAWTWTSDTAAARLGTAVSTAGDVDGDGYSDVLVGAPGWSDGTSTGGRALAFLGSRLGLSTSPAWILDGTAAGDELGAAVSTAGDVNADGFSDVLVGAPFASRGETNEGAALVFLGSLAGLATTPLVVLESDEPGALLGAVVAHAGDVNGDGRSDIAITAQYGDGVAIDGGRVQLHLGADAGPSAVPDWTAAGTAAIGTFGLGLASAGDVNGDGYSDLAIGEPRHSGAVVAAGRAVVYLGSPAGLPATPSWSFEGDQVGEAVGETLAGAMDCDGDGFGDLIVGAPAYRVGGGDQGAAFVFLGNDGGGLSRRPRQARPDGAAPLEVLGATDSVAGFRLRALGRSPFGRDDVRLEWEVAALGQALDGSGVQAASWLDTGDPGPSGSAAELDERHGPLSVEGPHHWRLRVRSGFPLPWASPWMSPAANAVTETDLRGVASTDTDADTVPDILDSCPFTANPAQADADRDRLGDACDACPADPANDVDGDGACANADNCPLVANPAQDDADADGRGDACDPCPQDALDDADADGLCADADNCPAVANAPQDDGDADGRGDACDACPQDPLDDADMDGACADADNCPTAANPSQSDLDADGLGDACDACPFDPVNDGDGDGACGDVDNCPVVANPAQADTDADGAGDACDACPADPADDADMDGLCADADPCPTDPTNRCARLDLLRNATLTRLAFDLHATILTAGRDPVLDPVRDLLQADVGGLAEVRVPGDGAAVGPGQPGALVFYEVTNTAGPLRLSRDGPDVVLRGWL